MFSRQGRVRIEEEAIWGNGNSRWKARERRASVGFCTAASSARLEHRMHYGRRRAVCLWMQTEARSGRDLSVTTKSLSVEVTEPCKNVKQVNDTTKSPVRKAPLMVGRGAGEWMRRLAGPVQTDDEGSPRTVLLGCGGGIISKIHL